MHNSRHSSGRSNLVRTRRVITPKPRSASEAGSKEETLRWVALGGLEEIGRNMMFFEYKDEIVIIDAGLQFPEEETPGIDYIIPNTTYLESRKQNIKALIITHGHYDHIGAIPYILGKLGNPPIYTTRLSKEIILKRQDDFPNSPKPIFQIVKGEETIQLGKYFSITFFDVFHNIPEGFGMIIRTPIGKIVHPGEFKFDYDHEGNPKGLDVWKKVGEEKIHTLMIDSTGAETPGFALSERIVEKELEKLFKSASGRIIVGTFASLLDRLAEIIKIADRLGRKIAISGFSMKSNIQIAQNLGYMKIPKGTIIPLEEINKHKDEKILILCTGAQGEPNAALMRVANGEHRHIHLKTTDTIILSSSIVPGNERSVQNLKDNLARQGATIYHYKMLDIHSSGHAPQEELKTVMKLVKPRFFLPIHGYYFMRWRNAKTAQEALGLKSEETLLADNGLVVELRKDSAKVTDEQLPAYYVMVDGLGVGDVGEVVLRDRRTLAQEGMIVIIVSISRQNGRILKNPDIISRGFIYLKENQEMLEEIRKKIRGIIGRIPAHQPLDADYLKTLVRDQIGQFLYNKTERRPMILPVIIEI
ncbi:MAG: RNA-metabolising metallo-beta-lactamase [Candidatus Jorgensenbacteria bacterium GW2011_GWA1_48_11]|uniref:Ribonuclease J n=1 Tax=Candidatus Jorgensenbacteria bacterium GW2011_GWA1_48_11 TaxID=1618660 RepID=A0A0G1XB37_9BACT|nr:MAG: RNA-metabolising metallo-beta-lactamase [Candidatus Jorgensenbacteria bacterium GW2011_GWA1_48_11]KKW12023.1 MAG: RNA-metabolising metallo-beta-lactamase [Candidatus Jorgensenbacteria bacterium GW2011_GWB1_49_9]